MGVQPGVEVHNVKVPMLTRPGMSGRIAIIGAFDTVETNPIDCSNLREAYLKLGEDRSYAGVSALDKLCNKYGGASSLLAVNITTKTGSGENEVISKDLTVEKLVAALAKIKGEKFDQLFIAAVLEDSALTIVETFLEETALIKKPYGFIAPTTRNTKALYETTVGIFGDQLNGLITQQFIVNGELLSLIDSAAYYAGLVAGMNVSQSFTMKRLQGVTGVTPEYTFEEGDLGAELVKMGVSVAKCTDRTNDYYVIVNSEQPNGLDLYINRTRDYVIKQFALEAFLGEKNKPVTITGIKSELERVRKECVDSADLLEDIQYEVEKVDAHCVNVYIDSLVFAGVITKIDVYVKVEVE